MHVLIVGGGIGGLTAATSVRRFDRNVNITLVEPKDYVEIHWASVRNIFDSEMAQDSTFDIAKWAVSKSVKVVRQKVTRLSESDATLADGTVLEFNVAIICTGAQTKFPALGRGPPQKTGNRQRRLAQLESEGKKYVQARSVLIVGGGLIGIEFAGDLAYYSRRAGNTNIKITLVHSQSQLCPEEFNPKAAALTQSKLEALGVEVILNEKVVKEGIHVKLQSTGKQVQAEQVVWTTGNYSVNSSFLESKYLDRKGWVRVDDYFRVKGAERSLFALGDCCDLLPNAGTQILGCAGIIGKNVRVALDAIQIGNFDNLESKMRKALVQSETYVCTIGKESGIVQTPCCYTQFFLPWIKNSTMFLFKPKKELGLK